MPDEEAFSLFVRLMHSYDLRGHFLPEMPKLQLRLVSVLSEYHVSVVMYILVSGMSQPLCSQ
jgi:hypothetical protein